MVSVAVQEEEVIPSDAILVVLCLYGFYLLDSAMLLYGNELVFVEAFGQWRFSTGSHTQLARRNPYLPNPLTPGAMLFRVAWSTSARDLCPRGDEALRQFRDALRPLQNLMCILLALLLGAFPVLLLIGPRSWLAAAVGSIYVVIITCLVYTYGRRRCLGWSGSAFASLAFEALACPPLALNMVRKTTLRAELREDPLAFACNNFGRETFKLLVSSILDTVEEELDAEEEPARRQELEGYREYLVSTVA